MNNNKKILLVDYDENIRRVIRLYFEKAGMNVVCTGNGRDALSLAASEQPDAVIMDSMLPGLSGFTLCKKLKSAEETKHILLVMISGDGRVWHKSYEEQPEVDYFKMKPFSPKKLVAQVKELIENGNGVRKTKRKQISDSSEIPMPAYPSYIVPEPEKTSNFEKRFIFKELSSKYELLQMFALRYYVYRHVNYIKPNNAHIDIDCYDWYSSFLGAFELTGNTKRLIGTVRIISGDQISPHASTLHELFHDFKKLDISDYLQKPVPLPIMETFDLPGEFSDVFSSTDNSTALNAFKKPYEISRLAVLPEYWGSKYRIEKNLRDLVVIDARKSIPKKNIFVIATHPKNMRKYQHLGFRIIPNTKDCIYRGIGQPAIALYADFQDYFIRPIVYSPKYDFMLSSYMQKGYFATTRVISSSKRIKKSLTDFAERKEIA